MAKARQVHFVDTYDTVLQKLTNLVCFGGRPLEGWISPLRG